MKDLKGLLSNLSEENLEKRIRKIYNLIKGDFISREELINDQILFTHFLVKVADFKKLESRVVDFFVYSLFNKKFDFEKGLNIPKSNDPRVISVPFKLLVQIQNRFLDKIEVKTIVDFGSGEGFFIWTSSIFNGSLNYIGLEIDKTKYEKSQILLESLNRKRIFQRDFFDFEYEDGKESIAFSYDPFEFKDEKIVQRFLEKLKSLRFKHIILIEGYTQHFSKNIDILDNYKVVDKIKNYKDSNKERERFTFCLSLK